MYYLMHRTTTGSGRQSTGVVASGRRSLDLLAHMWEEVNSREDSAAGPVVDFTIVRNTDDLDGAIWY